MRIKSKKIIFKLKFCFFLASRNGCTLLNNLSSKFSHFNKLEEKRKNSINFDLERDSYEISTKKAEE